MKVSRICRPTSVRTGMFCRFGRFAESRPVAAVVCEKVVCRRPSSPISSGNGSR